MSSTDELYDWAKTPLVSIPVETKREAQRQILDCLYRMDECGVKEIRDGFSNEEWVVIYGLFNSQERRTLGKILSNT